MKIFKIKKRPSEVLERFRQHSPQDIVISTITLFELEYGVEKVVGRINLNKRMPVPNKEKISLEEWVKL